MEMVVIKVSNKDLANLGIRQKFEFKVESQSIHHIHHNIQLNPDLAYHILQINVTELWETVQKYAYTWSTE